MNRLTLDEMINQEGYFDGWDDKEQFMGFRSEMLKAYEMLSEDEQEYVDDSMIMEHIAMVASVYKGQYGQKCAVFKAED